MGCKAGWCNIKHLPIRIDPHKCPKCKSFEDLNMAICYSCDAEVLFFCLWLCWTVLKEISDTEIHGAFYGPWFQKNQ